MLNFLINNTDGVKLLFFVMGFIALTVGIYQLTKLSIEFIVMCRNNRGNVASSLFGCYVTLIFLSAYLLHSL